jgi:transposase
VDTISMQYDSSSLSDVGDTPGAKAPYIQHNGRREYSQSFKLRLLEEAMAPGASVSVVARRYNINTNVVFRWRALHRKGLLGNGGAVPERALIPVGVIGEDGRLKPVAPSADAGRPRGGLAEAGPKGQPSACSRVRIALSDRLSVHFDAGIEAGALRRILEVARGFA